MQRAGVESSSVRWVGYDLEDHVLEIGFVGGGVYHYLDVPPEAALALLEADSIGRHLNAEIKPAYECRPVHRAS
ncbi:KTSC domain-containing protein [Modestobacter lacusdianchii]